MEYTLSNSNDINNAVNALKQKMQQQQHETAARYEAGYNAIKEETRKLFQADLDSVLPWEAQQGLAGVIEPALSIEGTKLKFNLNGREFELQRQLKENNQLSWKVTSANYSQALNSDNFQQELLLYLSQIPD